MKKFCNQSHPRSLLDARKGLNVVVSNFPPEIHHLYYLLFNTSVILHDLMLSL